MQDAGLHIVEAERIAHLDRPDRDLLDLAEATLQRPEADLVGEQPGALGRRLLGQQRQRPLERLAAAPRLTQRPLGVGELAEQPSDAKRLAVGVELGDRVLEQGGAAGIVGAQVVIARGARHQVGEIDAGEPLGVGYAGPEPERPVEQPGGLAIRVDPLGAVRRLDRGSQGLGLLAGSVVVVGDRGGQPGALLGVGPGGERPRQGQVQFGALAGQQVVIEHLAKQRVAKPEPVGLVGVEHVGGERLAKPRVELRALEAAGGRERGFVGLPGDRKHRERASRVWRESLEAGQQSLAQGRRQRPATVEPAGEQLLGEQRVALAAIEEAGDDVGRRKAAEDVGELCPDLVTIERPQLEAARAATPLELGQQRPQRMAPVQLVGSIGGDHDHPLVAQARCEEGKEGACRAVRPVQVLEPEDDRLGASEPLEQREQGIEQPSLRLPLAVLEPFGRRAGRAPAPGGPARSGSRRRARRAPRRRFARGVGPRRRAVHREARPLRARCTRRRSIARRAPLPAARTHAAASTCRPRTRRRRRRAAGGRSGRR